jgi:hypothetical protein
MKSSGILPKVWEKSGENHIHTHQNTDSLPQDEDYVRGCTWQFKKLKLFTGFID